MGKMFSEDPVASLYSSYSPWPQRAPVLTVQYHQSTGLSVHECRDGNSTAKE